MSYDLFSQQKNFGYQPLADRVQPISLENYQDKSHILGEAKPLKENMDSL